MKTAKPALLIVIMLILFWMINSCNSLIPDDNLKPGTYHANGTQVEIIYDFPWPSWGGDEVILSRDTSDVEFTFIVERIKGKRDSVYFVGLEGANAGEWNVLPPDHTYPSRHAAYARYSRNKLEFDLGITGGSYSGIGQVQPGVIKLDTHFEYRRNRTDYDLIAVKIKD